MKRILSIVICLCLAVFAYAVTDPFRAHKYDLFKVLPVNDKSIVFVGNSITNMHEWWEAFGSDANILNRGVWGTFISETVEHIEAVAVGKPKKVFFMIGTNDLGKNGSRNIDAIVEDTRIMVDRLQRVSPETEIYIQGILPSVYNRELSQLAETNERLKVLCRDYNITYVNLWDGLISLTTDQTHTLDGLHLKASGYQVWTKQIETLIGAKTVYPENCATAQSTGGISHTSLAMRATIFSMLPVNPGDVMVIGDEMIHGGAWHELLRSNKVKNRGSGWGYGTPGLDIMAQEVPIIFNNRSGSCQPSKVLLYGGAAELNGSASLSTIETNYMNVVNKIKQYAPNATICLMSAQPTSSSYTNTNRVVPFNEKLKTIAANDAKIEYIDIYTDFVSNNVASSSYFSNSYLNAFGYVKVAQKIAQALPDENFSPLTDEEARRNYRTFELRSALGNALVVASKLKQGDGAGEYSASALAELNSLVDAAYALLSNGGSETEFTTIASQITSAASNALRGINQPQKSSGGEEYWYKLYTPNRGSRYLTSNGAGVIATGTEANIGAKSQWKFVDRGDGSVDIVNRENSTYLNPNSSYNTAIYTTTEKPAKGWTFEYSNSPGLYIIKSGTVQLNQTNSDLGWKVYNWSSGGTGQDRNDTGCQYKIESVVEAPEVPVLEEALHFSFTRGSTLANSVVNITDASGKAIDGMTATIKAAGAASWLVDNNAADQSILCVNVNTNATTEASPITYTLEISGLDNDVRIKNFTFRSVALNKSGQWQGATEIRHCNFVCSYGENESSLVVLPAVTDESIMVGGGEPKDVTFAVDNISAVDGKLVVKLKLYKGTNNNGCFYGLTKIMMDVEKGGTDEPEPDPDPLGTATFQLSSRPLTANELNAKTEPTYIAIKNLSSGNHDWLFANANEANYSRDFSNDAVYIWQPVQGEAGKFYLKRTDGTYMQTTSPKDFGAIAGAAKFAATHPQRAQNSYYDDAEPYIDIEQDEDPCLVRFVNQDNKWINCQWPNSAPIYNTGNGSWTIHYAYEAKKVEGFKVNIDETKYSTMFTTYNVDLSEVDGISAYYIQEGAFHDGSVKLTPIEHDVLPALTAVILYAEVAGEYTLPYTTKTGASVEENLLEGNFVDSYIIHEGYILSNSNMGVGLYKAAMNKRNGTAFLNNGGKAYLPVSAVPAAQQGQGFKFGDFTPTAIDGAATGNTGVKVVYDLSGRRINGITTAGVYIINGKKVMVK